MKKWKKKRIPIVYLKVFIWFFDNIYFLGWMNILKEKYNARKFRVNDIQSVLIRLDGNMLRISQPERFVFRHAFHTDPSLEGHDPKIIGQGIYDLTNAQVVL